MSWRIEKTSVGADIVVEGFENGIADSPYQGISDMRNANIISVPGEASVNFKSQSIAQVPISGAAFTVAASVAGAAGIFTYSGTLLKAGTQITLNTLTGGTSSLPGVNMVGNSASITSQYSQVDTGPTRIITTSNGSTGTSANIKIGLISNPNNGDEVALVINSTQVLIHFVTAIGAVAGNVLIGANADATAANLRFLLQHPSTTNSTQVALSGPNQTLVGYFTTDSQIVFDKSVTASGAGALSFNSAATSSLTNGMAVLVINCEGVPSRTATWGGVSMTDVSGSNDPSIQTFMLANPPAGVATVTVSGGGATEATAMTFSGVFQTVAAQAAFTDQAGNGAVAGVGDVTMSITPTYDASVPLLIVDSTTTYSAGTNITIVNAQSRLSIGRATLPVHPIAATSYTMTRDGGGTGVVGRQIGALRPITPTNVTIGLTTTASYWVASSTSTTFTLSSVGPYATGAQPNVPVIVPASGSGTFSTAVNMSLLTQIVPNATNTAYYGIDTNGRVWVYALTNTSTNWVYLGNTVTAASTPDFNTGIAVWNGYIFALYDGTDGYSLYTCPVTATPPVFTAFQDLINGPYPHRTFTDVNGTLYWCDGNAIGSLIQVTTFDPNNSATYVWTQNNLPILPENEVLQCINQLGSNLLLGGLYNFTYSWDKLSSDAIPIYVPENNCHRIVTVNSNAYLFVGNRGRIYITNGANAQLYKKVPDHISNTIEPIFVWGGAMYNKNQLYFALSAFTSSVSGETGISQYGGIWAIDTNTNALRLVNKLSYDTYGGYTAEMCGMIANATTTSGITIQNFGLVCGWEDSTETASPNYGSDVLPVNSSPAISNVPYSNYETYVDSDMIPIGTYLNPVTDANVEWKLTNPMVTGEGIKLQYRQDLSQAFADITGSEVTTAGVFSGVVQVNFQKSQWLQIRTLTKSTSTTPSYTRLKELRIR